MICNLNTLVTVKLTKIGLICIKNTFGEDTQIYKNAKETMTYKASLQMISEILDFHYWNMEMDFEIHI